MSLGTLGRYRLIRKLAQGGMAEVFLAKSYGAHGFEKPVAIKRILGRYASDKQFVTMLIDEAKITSLLNHPNVVPVIDFNADGKDCYLVMEYVAGRSMAGLLKMLANGGRQMSTEHLLYMVRESALGLHHAHQKADRTGQPLKIVHRDVSPQNILLSFDGHVRVIDFGIARARNRLAETEAGTLKGKLRYMSPEQVEGKDVDGRADQFALGITLWEALTDRVLFDGDNDVQVIDAVVGARVPDPREYNRNIPEELARAVLKSLHRAASGRYASCDSFAAELRGILARLNPDYDPATLGTLMRKQFAQEIEEDTREEAEAEAELERAGALGPPRDAATSNDHPVVAPAAAARGEASGSAARPRVRTSTNALGAGKEDPARARKASAQKGMRPSEARRAAEAHAAGLDEEANGFLHESTNEGPPANNDRHSGPKGVVVPVGVPPASPHEVTRHFDPRTLEPPKPAVAAEPVKPEQPAAKGSAAAAPAKTTVKAKAKPKDSGRGRTMVAIISGVAGALGAVVMGLVWVARTDATPARKPRPPAEAAQPGAGEDEGADPSGTTTSTARKDKGVLNFAVNPSDARVTVDREPVHNLDTPLVLPAGRHVVFVKKEGFEDEQRIVELAEGDKKTLDVTLVRLSAPARDTGRGNQESTRDEPRTAEDGRAADGRREDSRKDEPRKEDARRDEPARREDKPARKEEPRREEARKEEPRREEARKEEPRKEEPRKEDKAAAKKADKPAEKAPVATGKGTLKVIMPGSWAEVELDGKPTGKNTPLVLEVASGDHTITFRRGGASSQQKVTVAPGATEVVKGQL